VLDKARISVGPLTVNCPAGADPGVNLPRVEDLMFGSGALVRILCDSR
jgi:hypothetical protein